MGEVLAGILLGPTLLGAVAPEVAGRTSSRRTSCRCSAPAPSIGLAFYLFLVGHGARPARSCASRVGAGGADLEHERRVPDGARLPRRAPDLRDRSRRTRTTCRSRCSWASRCRSRRSRCWRGSWSSAGCSSRPVGALAMAGAAIDDVTAWGLLALATAVAGARLAGSTRSSIVGLAGAVHASAMILVGRPLLGPRLDRLRRGRPRPAALARRSSSSACCSSAYAVAADRDRGHLRRLRDGADHAAPRRADRAT